MSEVQTRHSHKGRVPERPVTPTRPRLVDSDGRTLHFEDSEGQHFDARLLQCVLPVGCTATEAQERLIVATLLSVGQKKRAAELLAIPLRTFHKLCHQYGVPSGEQELQARALQLGVREPDGALDEEAHRLGKLGRDLGISLDLAPPPRGQVWVAPGFDPLAMTRELIRQATAKGGVIDQQHLYGEGEAAIMWLGYEQQDSYAAVYQSLPLGLAAEAIHRLGVSTEALDVIALGPGGARREVALVQHLLDQAPSLHHLRLYLLDLSQPLLWVAFKYAADTLAQRRGVFPLAVQGNMHHLACYEELLYQSVDAPRRRLATMLGGTFGNLQHEPSFVRDVLGASLSPGDLLLFDVCLRPSRPEEDPRLQGRIAPDQNKRLYDWLSLPLLRHGGARSVDIRVNYSEGGVIPGSAALEYLADTEDGRRFRLARIGRYDPAQTVSCIEELGWRCITTLPFGEKESYPRALFLFEKGEETAVRR